MDGNGSKRVRTRVNRIAGQVAGIQRMVDEGRYCVEILNQIAAVRSALDALGIELLTRHLESCVLAVQNVRFDLLRLRSAGVAAVLGDLTNATQQARALSRDVDNVIAAAGEIREVMR